MTWIKKIDLPPPPHICRVPDALQYEIGSIWQCDKCKKRMQIIEAPRPYKSFVPRIWHDMA